MKLVSSNFLEDAYPRHSMAARTVYWVKAGIARNRKAKMVLGSGIGLQGQDVTLYTVPILDGIRWS